MYGINLWDVECVLAIIGKGGPLEAERRAEEESNRERRDVVVEARQGTKIAKEKLDDAKRARAADLAKEKAANQRRVTQEKALEMVSPPHQKVKIEVGQYVGRNKNARIIQRINITSFYGSCCAYYTTY
eukprot:5092951-Pyramimonas_sp.AAC.1